MIVRVDNRVRLQSEELPAAVASKLRAEYTRRNPDKGKLAGLRDTAEMMRRKGSHGGFARLYAMIKEVESAPENIATWDSTVDEFSVPRGGLQKIRELLAEEGIECDVEFDVEEGRGPTGIPRHRMKLWDFQEQLVIAAMERETCLWRSPTGSGKTSAALALASRLDVPTLVIVWTGNLLEQWVARCGKELGLVPNEVGVIRGSKRVIKPITIGMQQTLAKCGDEYAREFGLVICDEVDKFAARTFRDVIDRYPARYRVGVSADERRKDRREFLIYDSFGPVAAEVNRQDLEDRGIVHDVEVRMVPTKFAPAWYVAMPEFQRPLAHDKLLRAMAIDDERNAVIEQLATEVGSGTIVFSHLVDHCHRLRAALVKRGVRAGLLIGGKEFESDFRATRASLEVGEMTAAVGTYKAIALGLDIPPVDRGVCATPIHGDRALVGQVRGRLCRTAEGKTGAVLYVLWDREIHGKKPLVNMVRWNRRVRVLVDGELIEAREYLGPKGARR